MLAEAIANAAIELGRHITMVSEQMAAAFYVETGHMPEVQTHEYHGGATVILCERHMGPCREVPAGLAEPLAAEWAKATSLPASQAQVAWWLDGPSVVVEIQPRRASP